MIVIVLILTGLFAGVVTAAGLFSLITSVGVINRYADVTETGNNMLLYEECIIVGAVAANVVYVLGLNVPLGVVGCVAFGLLSGVFVGTFLVSLAETMKGLPIFVDRAKAGQGLGFIVAFIAAGKVLGQLAYYLFMY